MSSGIIIDPLDTVLNVKDGSLDPCCSIFLSLTFPFCYIGDPIVRRYVLERLIENEYRLSLIPRILSLFPVMQECQENLCHQ